MTPRKLPPRKQSRPAEIAAAAPPVVTTHHALGDDVFLTSAQVRGAFGGISEMALWRWAKNPRIGLPPPDAVIARRKYWRAATIRKFQDRMTAGPKTIEVTPPPPPAKRGRRRRAVSPRRR